MTTALVGTPTENNVLQVSSAFKKEVTKSIFAIVAFTIVYLLLFALSICLGIASIYGGIQLIIHLPKIITILIGAGMIGLGVMVFIFLVKFMFAQSQKNASDSIEITAEEQPELVAFIHQVAKETNTSIPKKIFISHDVNACVFYNSSFWSMFLPVKKNLKIGLGLINSVNVSEFKAVIAHEFGHFSQRSMKLGSFVYHVNHIIHDMLFNNNGYADTLNAWSKIHAAFGFFAQLTIKIVQGIQWVLKQMYKVVNKSYLGLSRQMEFHADLVAASTSGSNNIISALQRIEFSDACFNTTLHICNKIWKENKVAADIYDDHRLVIKHVAKENNLRIQDGLPEVDTDIENSNAQRINFKNQWASHPTLRERKEYLDSFSLTSEVEPESAWKLLRNRDQLKQELTRKIYQHLPIDDQKKAIDDHEFETVYHKEVKIFSLPEVFKGYYNERQIEVFNVDDHITAIETGSLEELLTDENIRIPRNIQLLTNDIEVLKAIEKKEVDTKTFDFDGKKYKRKEANEIKGLLEAELEDQKKALQLLDKKLFNFFYQAALQKSVDGADTYIKKYKDYFGYRKDAEKYFQSLELCLQLLHPIYSGATLELEQINPLINTLKNDSEAQLKEDLRRWLTVGVFNNEVDLKIKVEKFIKSDYQYFSGNSFFDNELIELNEIIHESYNCLTLFLFEEYKSILQLQASFVTSKEIEIAV